MIFDLIISLLGLLLWAFFAYLMLSALYLLVFAVAGRVKRTQRTSEPSSPAKRRFAVFLPGYKEDSVIIDAARAALAQMYPSDLFTVLVLADSFQVSTVKTLRSMGAVVNLVSPTPRTKAGSLNLGLANMDAAAWDVAVVLDADNIVHPDFLSRLNEEFSRGARAVQCQRTAKNTDTSVALLDGISEGVSNHIFRRGHRALGLSSGLIGSGMAFEFSLFSQLMRSVRVINGFDKDLEFRLFAEGIRIEYAEDIHVLDEKVRSAEVFEAQRSRWFASHWNFLKDHIAGSKGVVVSADYIDKVLQMTMLPRMLLLAVTTLMTLVSVLLPVGPAPGFWGAGLLAAVSAIVLSIPSRFLTMQLVSALVALPGILRSMVRAISRIGVAQRRFVHTPHGSTAHGN